VALELNGEVVLGVLDDGEVRNIIQFEVAEAMAKQRLRDLPAAVMGGDWRLALRW
jgi:hypothetical protein